MNQTRWMGTVCVAALVVACNGPGSGGQDGGSVQGAPDAAPARCETQAAYTYPGCANQDSICPRNGTLACAYSALLAAHSADGGDQCATDDDCVVAIAAQGCSGVGRCPAATLNRTAAPAFVAAVDAEQTCYCAGSNVCTSAGACTAALAGAYGAACCGGTCRLRTAPADAGAQGCP